MKARALRWSAPVFVVGLFSLLTSGCVVPGGGYGYQENVGFGLGYYEPVGVRYGGWGGGYSVGPVRGGVGYEQHGGHGAPAPRSIPSIPSRERTSGGEGHR